MGNLFYLFSSPSLVALEMNSEDDSTEPMSPFSPFLPDGEKSEDKLETFSPFTTLSCTRSQSASSYEHTSKVKCSVACLHHL